MDTKIVLDCISRETQLRNTLNDRVLESISRFSQNGVFILGGRNEFFVFQDGKQVFDGQCTTAKQGFGTQWGSLKTPTGMHEIGGIIGQGIPPLMSINLRKPTGNILDVNGRSAIVGRLVEMRGIESVNRSTDSRDIYLHGTPNIRFWRTEDFRQSSGCIGLLPDESVKVAQILGAREQGLIYISQESHI